MQRDIHFAVGDWVYLKLRPYSQKTVYKKLNEKLAPQYNEPFEVEAKVSQVAYKLKLVTGILQGHLKRLTINRNFQNVDYLN